jgi:hypothetical protein
MRDDVTSEIVRLDRIAKRARAHRARGEALGDFLLEMRASRLEAVAEARLDATVRGERSQSGHTPRPADGESPVATIGARQGTLGRADA